MSIVPFLTFLVTTPEGLITTDCIIKLLIIGGLIKQLVYDRKLVNSYLFTYGK